MLNALLVMGGLTLFLGVVIILAEIFLATYGPCAITINQEKKIEVQGGGHLLGALLQNKIFIPSACGGKASCGFCKVKVIAGGGPVLPTEKAFLSKAEISQNWRLACQVKIRSDLTVEFPAEFLNVKEYRVTCLSIRELTHDIKEFIFQIEEPGEISFKPGQYVQFKIPDTGEFRAYSVASKPSEAKIIKLIVRLVPEGLCTTYMHTELKVNDLCVLTGPYGEFYLREDSSKDIIMIGGGSGMAPILSILGHLQEQKSVRKAVFFFGARSRRDLYYTDELRKVEAEYPNFKYVPALSEPAAADEWKGEVGLITNVVGKFLPENAHNFEAYLCGPPVMIDAAIKVLTSRGIAEKEIYFDKF